ncbi:MAG: hypothetical protein LUC37_04840 [Prevotella sp.]|nr:hypothetical protein [Prevotella sp.]
MILRWQKGNKNDIDPGFNRLARKDSVNRDPGFDKVSGKRVGNDPGFVSEGEKIRNRIAEINKKRLEEARKRVQEEKKEKFQSGGDFSRYFAVYDGDSSKSRKTSKDFINWDKYQSPLNYSDFPYSDIQELVTEKPKEGIWIEGLKGYDE